MMTKPKSPSRKVKRKRRKVNSGARERTLGLKKIAETIKMVEVMIAQMTDPELVLTARVLRECSDASWAEEPTERLHNICSDATRFLLETKEIDIPLLRNFADDEAFAASIHRFEATVETGIRLIGEQGRLIDKALATEPVSTPLQ
jgi:hypothetical protein